MTLPNFITIARFIMVPLIILAMINDEMPTAFTLFLLAGVSDGLDGFIARHFDQKSELGAWLDPIADKLLVGAALLGLAMVLKTWLIYIPAAAIIARDVFMTWLRTTPAGKAVVDPSDLAKWKTGFEMAAIIGLMLPLAFAPADLAADAAGSTPLLFSVGAFLLVGMLWVAAALSLLTGWRYIRAARAGN